MAELGLTEQLFLNPMLNTWLGSIVGCFCTLTGITGFTKRLNVRNIIASTFGYWDNVIDCKLFLFATSQTVIIILFTQGFKFCGRVVSATFCLARTTKILLLHTSLRIVLAPLTAVLRYFFFVIFFPVVTCLTRFVSVIFQPTVVLFFCLLFVVGTPTAFLLKPLVMIFSTPAALSLTVFFRVFFTVAATMFLCTCFTLPIFISCGFTTNSAWRSYFSFSLNAASSAIGTMAVFALRVFPVFAERFDNFTLAAFFGFTHQKSPLLVCPTGALCYNPIRLLAPASRPGGATNTRQGSLVSDTLFYHIFREGGS